MQGSLYDESDIQEGGLFQQPSTWLAMGAMFGAASVACYQYGKMLNELPHYEEYNED